MQPLQFSRRDYLFFIAAITLLVAGFLCVALDPVAYGFGIATLWIAPPLLLTGFALPIAGIAGSGGFRYSRLVIALKADHGKHIIGAVVLLIAFITYLCTLEPTASLWDCSEFIASAFKLQVSHTPGTPLCILIARVFTMLSFNDVTKVAWTINMMSGLFSALTVWMVYYTIHHLIARLSFGADRLSWGAVLAAAGGSLCVAFSDSFWFSAVEAETYAAACFFLMVLVWLILTGKDLPDAQRARRLVLIAYVAGLAYCIHPMCLLALPVLPFTWYTRRRTLSWANVSISAAAGFLIVFVINRVVAIGLFQASFSADLLFVNTLHMPFYTGVIIFFLFMTVVFVVVLRRYPRAAVYTWSVVFLLVGFAPYMLLFLRSAHNPPIDETNPEDLYMIKAYMNRDSYPSSPLVFGPYFDADIEDVTVKTMAYIKGKDAYEPAGPLIDYRYARDRQTILPRLYSRDPDHIEAYRDWLGLRPGQKPTFTDNLRFMFTAQLGHMYLRYFLFNLAGRESDIQGSDWLRPWDSLTDSDHANPARNQYWMLPLLAGILGLVRQYRSDRKGFFSILIFFLITGAGLALYLNSPPVEPRERDYIYVGSYIAFFLWTGTGFYVAGRFFRNVRYARLLTGALSILMPLWMFFQNYNDHNRSGRTFQVDSARNTLRSCAPDAILFTGGDNDTFPLWYLQEVEGFRTDVRVVVLSYFNTDWYIDQLSRKYYESKSFALTLDRKAYRQYGPNDVLYVQESIKDGIDARKFLQLLRAEYPALAMRTQQGDTYNIIPSRTLNIRTEIRPVRTAATGSYADTTQYAELTLKLTENYLYKNALALVDLIVSNHWQRPVYFNFTSMNTVGLDLTPYLAQEGTLFRLQPHASADMGMRVDKAQAYKNLLEDADYTNLGRKDVYFNYEDYALRIITPLRQSFNALAAAYLSDGEDALADKVLRFAVDKLYPPHLAPSYASLQTAELLMAAGNDTLARPLIDQASRYAYERIQQGRSRGRPDDQGDLYMLNRSSAMLQALNSARDTQHLNMLESNP